jgi:serine phosphatase RsbU (regulator of sigma subunit)
MYPKKLHILLFHLTTFLGVSFLLVSFCAYAQELGNPFVQSYMPKEYQAATQNWDIVQDELGIMYFANNEGVLQFNGVDWSVTPVSNKSTVRSLDLDNNGIIYAGGINEFGYLRPNETGKLEYVSISANVGEEDKKFGDIWRTIATREGVYFQSNTHLFRWAKGKIKVWKPKKRRFQMIAYVHDRFFVKEPETPLMEMVRDEIVKFRTGDLYEKESILNLLSYEGDKMLAYSSKTSFQIISLNPKTEVTITKLPTEVDSALVKHGIYTMSRQPDGTYVLPTRRGGSFIIDKNGKLLRKLQRAEGLHSETHYAACTDKQNGLWIGTNNGIIYVEVNAPLTIFNDRQGLEGTTYCISRIDGVLYIGTSLGVFYLDKSANLFRQIEGLSAQVWEIKKVVIGGETKILLASAGLFELKNNKVIPLVQSSLFTVYPSPSNPLCVYFGGRDFIASLVYKSGKWEEEGRIKMKGDDIRSIIEDKSGTLWASVNLNGVRKITLNGNKLDSTATLTKYDTAQGLPLKENIFFNIGGEMLVATEKGVKRYSTEGNNFVPYSKFGTQFGDGTYAVSNLLEDNRRNVWLFANKGKQYLLGVSEYQNDGTYKWNPTPYYRIPAMTEVTFWSDDNEVIWFGGSEGLFRFDSKIRKKYDDKPRVLVSRVFIGEDADSTLFGGVFSKDFKKSDGEMVKIVSLTQTKEQVPILPNQFNSFAFSFAMPSYDDAKSNQYSHQLEGYDDVWSHWSTNSKKEYTNLYEGAYTFKVKARNIYGVESEIATYKLNVLPPWFRSAWAYITYVIMAALAVYGFIWFSTRRLQKENEKLERLVTERTAQIAQATEELAAQAENLKQANTSISLQNSEINKQKEQVEKAYTNVRVLSEIGQKITSTLNIEQISKLVYKNVNSLMDATGFGLGVYNAQKHTIDFKGFVERGEILPDHYDSMNDEGSLAVRCLKSNEELIINDYRHEYVHYINKKAVASVGNLPASIIYLPLQIEDRPVGVVTVQSFILNAYNDNNLTILRTLASYIAIAIDNAHSYYIIEEKNKHITDSIRYARTIQQASLPGRKRMAEALKDYFVIFKPKDIVSGDFYWLNHIVEENEQTGEKLDEVFVAVADCTGHGVPGGFMSMIGNNLLNEIIKMQHIYDPARVLELLDEGVILALRQNEKSNDDGMDIMLCAMEYNGDNVKITVSGAKTTMYYVREGENIINDLRGDNRLIGGTSHKSKPFTNKIVELNAGDMLYMSSDGYPDQNAPDGLKFGKERFREMISRNAYLPISEQKALFEEALNQHQQTAEQRDDITVVGIKL